MAAAVTDRAHHHLDGYLALVVDDDARIRAYIRTVLESAGVRVVEARDGVEALAAFEDRRGQLDLVVTDIRMPHMTGTDLAISIRSLAPDTPVIFVSGEPAPVDGNNPKGGSLFVEKPFSPRVLLEATHRFLDSRPPLAA
jgi:two-component system cell cycle sensor histidine kinase/response regulator CckA